MALKQVYLGVVLTICALVRVTSGIPHSCKQLQESLQGSSQNETVASGEHHFRIGSENVRVYCEMGLNGGGYTFLSPESLTKINNDDLQKVINDTQSLLLRIRKCDGTQPYVVLEQLPAYENYSINFLHNSFSGYQETVNFQYLGGPYLYAGFLPKSIASTRTQQGIMANQEPITFDNCDGHANSYIALFPNFQEKKPQIRTVTDFPFCNSIFNGALKNPSTRVMPPEFYMFGEIHFGGCGCYAQTDETLRFDCILGLQIGFR